MSIFGNTPSGHMPESVLRAIEAQEDEYALERGGDFECATQFVSNDEKGGGDLSEWRPNPSAVPIPAFLKCLGVDKWDDSTAAIEYAERERERGLWMDRHYEDETQLRAVAVALGQEVRPMPNFVSAEARDAWAEAREAGDAEKMAAIEAQQAQALAEKQAREAGVEPPPDPNAGQAANVPNTSPPANAPDGPGDPGDES